MMDSSRLGSKAHFHELWQDGDFDALWNFVLDTLLATYSRGVAAGLSDVGGEFSPQPVIEF